MGQCIADQHVDRGAIVGWKLVGIVRQLRQEDVPIAGFAGGATNVANQAAGSSVNLERQAFRKDFQRRRGPPGRYPQLMHELGVPPRFPQGMAQAVAHTFQAQRQNAAGRVGHGRCRTKIANPLALEHFLIPSLGVVSGPRLFSLGCAQK